MSLDGEALENLRSNLRVQFKSDSTPSLSSSSSEEEEEEEEDECRPPDGGYGWVVVAAAFFTNLIADGITFTFGIIYVELLKYFKEGKSKTAWIGGIFMAMPLLSGPVASYLTDRFGCRKVCICGALLASFGFVLSSQAQSIEMLILTFGIISGFGLAMCFVSAVVIVAYYFDKKRSLATGLSVCGSGIGTFIFAPISSFLIKEYGWRGTTLILAGLFLNICVCGALMRDLEWTKRKTKAQRTARKAKHRDKRNETRSQSLKTASSSMEDLEELEDTRQCNSVLHLPTYIFNEEKVPVEVLELLAANQNQVYKVVRQNYPSLLVPALTQVKMDKTCSIIKKGLNQNHRRSLTYRGAMLNVKSYRTRATSCPDIYNNRLFVKTQYSAQWYDFMWDLRDVLVDMLDVSHFLDIRFLLFAISNFILYTWYHVPYVFLADKAIEMNFSENKASLLIAILGILNTLGEVILGWMGDLRWVNAGLVYASCMTACGCVTMTVPFISSFLGLCFASGGFGLSIAANYSLASIIIVKLITLDRFTNAYGLLLFVQGSANLIGPPIAGWLYDISGDYDLSFFLAGAFISVCGLILMILPAMKFFKRINNATIVDV